MLFDSHEEYLNEICHIKNLTHLKFVFQNCIKIILYLKVKYLKLF